MSKVRCEGWRKRGSVFSFGIPEWIQCENEAIVMLEVKQEEIETLPACKICWQEAIDRKMKILSVKPIVEERGPVST